MFPLRGKVPMTPQGFKDASADTSRVHGMFNAARGATGFGITTGGFSGLVVVDFDGDSPEATALRDSLPPSLEVKASRGRHRYLRVPVGTNVKTRKLASDVDLKADGGYIVGPGSAHPSGGRYEIAEETKAFGVADLPAGLLQAATKPKGAGAGGAGKVDDGGPIHDGERNERMASVAGRLHDGRRDLAALTRDLIATNEARCVPPLPTKEVAGIARSIFKLEPCKAAPVVTPEVIAKIDALETAAAGRAVKGMGGGSGWAVYTAGLTLLRRYGREHADGVQLSVDTRTWAEEAGTSAATVSRFLGRSPLVRHISRGVGRRRSVVVFVAPPSIGVKLQHSPTLGVSLENGTPASVATRPLLRVLYRLRWGPGRIGKCRAALLTRVAECPGASRFELAHALGRNPDGLKKPLKWLVEAGLLERVGRGRYSAPADLAERLDAARELAGEPESDRLQTARHERERDAYRNRRRLKVVPTPADGETRRMRESLPQRRRGAIRALLVRLFAEKPEYRGKRVGQVTCALYQLGIPDDFPRGDMEGPKDHEVERLLDGEPTEEVAA